MRSKPPVQLQFPVDPQPVQNTSNKAPKQNLCKDNIGKNAHPFRVSYINKNMLLNPMDLQTSSLYVVITTENRDKSLMKEHISSLADK